MWAYLRMNTRCIQTQEKEKQQGQLKWIPDLNLKPETLKMLQGDKSKILQDAGMVELSEWVSGRSEVAPSINKLNWVTVESLLMQSKGIYWQSEQTAY